MSRWWKEGDLALARWPPTITDASLYEVESPRWIYVRVMRVRIEPSAIYWWTCKVIHHHPMAGEEYEWTPAMLRRPHPLTPHTRRSREQTWGDSPGLFTSSAVCGA